MALSKLEDRAFSVRKKFSSTSHRIIERIFLIFGQRPEARPKSNLFSYPASLIIPECIPSAKLQNGMLEYGLQCIPSAKFENGCKGKQKVKQKSETKR